MGSTFNSCKFGAKQDVPMTKLAKLLESTTLIRFQDCDPFNHLNNAQYIDYFINAREDHLIENYGLNIYQLARDEGLTWIVFTNQIAYLKPALLMEEVVIQSQIIRYSEKDLTVELKMWDQKKEQLKSLMWSQFIHFNFKTQRPEKHSDRFIELFKQVINPVPEDTFNARLGAVRSSV